MQMVYDLTSNLASDTNIVLPMPLLHSLKEFLNRLTPVKLYVVYLLTLEKLLMLYHIKLY